MPNFWATLLPIMCSELRRPSKAKQPFDEGRSTRANASQKRYWPPLYMGYAVTSVNLNISMVRYLRRHLVCTTDCLREQ